MCRDAELDEALRLAGCDPATFQFDAGPDDSQDLLTDLGRSCKDLETLVTLRWASFVHGARSQAHFSGTLSPGKLTRQTVHALPAANVD